MPKPLAWSYSALSDFTNCPRAYYEKRVARSVQEAQSEQMLWGNRVHKAFENRQKYGTALPAELELQEHEPFMLELEQLPGKRSTERKIGLDIGLRPCSFFDKSVWWRGVIDFSAVKGKTARLVDYKTGKVKPDFRQLAMFAVHTFLEYPEVVSIDVEFYWTTTRESTAKNFMRKNMAELWGMFSPDLKQYLEAFKTDTWQPRQSGLCHGWCPVTDCEFWRPKKSR